MDMNGYEWLMASNGILKGYHLIIKFGYLVYPMMEIRRGSPFGFHGEINEKSPNSMKVSGVEMIYTVHPVNGGLSIAMFDYQRVREMEVDQERWGDLTRYNGA
jgi:hypothetical protein